MEDEDCPRETYALIRVLLIRKAQCVYNCKLTAPETNIIKSKGKSNRDTKFRQGNTMRKTPNTRPESPS